MIEIQARLFEVGRFCVSINAGRPGSAPHRLGACRIREGGKVMLKRLVAITALLILALFGCQDSEEGSPTSIVLGDSAKMSLRLVVPTNLNIDSGEITIAKGDIEYSQSVDLQDGSASVVFNEIQPGIWQIYVALYDSDEFMLYEGSGEAEVYGGETNSAHIVLTELSGDLEITIEMPPDEDDGLIAYYPFNGSAEDHSGNGFHGEVSGATLTNDRFGQPDAAYHFTPGDSVRCTNTVPLVLTSWTTTAWINVDHYGLHAGVLGKGEDPITDHNNFGFGIATDGGNNNTIRSDYENCSDGNHFLHAITAEPGEWYFVAYTRDNDSGETRLYVNNLGALDSAIWPDTPCETSRPITIGGLSYEGVIDDVRIYDRALSEAAIEELFNGEDALVTVPGASDPWLAGMPDGTNASGNDYAPDQSPVHVEELQFEPGDVLVFTATGGVGHGPVEPLYPPDGDLDEMFHHNHGTENGISNIVAPSCSLVGLFLDDSQPDQSPPPAALDFGSAASREYTELAPLLKQVFFIGDGWTGSGTQQNVIVPGSATRLYLGTMDSWEWIGNIGSFEVGVQVLESAGAAAMIGAK